MSSSGAWRVEGGKCGREVGKGDGGRRGCTSLLREGGILRGKEEV